MKIRKFSMKRENMLLLMLFAAFLFFRVFSNSEYYFIQAGDSAKYLVLAKNFPYHKAYNDQFYIVHPPLYPYAIHFASYLVEDHLAGILISIVSAAITFFIVYKSIILLNGNRYIALGALSLFALSQVFIQKTPNVLKEPFAIMLILSSIYFFALFLKKGKIANVWLSSFFGILTGLTSDHVLLLILSLITAYIIFASKDKLLPAAIPIVAASLSYAFWIFVRIYTYATNEFYKVGLDGTIVRVSDWGLRQLLSPVFFNDAASIAPFKIVFDPSHYIYAVAYMLNLAIAPWPSGLRFSNIGVLFSVGYILQSVIYAILALAAIYGAYKILKSVFSKGVRRNGMLLVLILLIIFLSPLTQEVVSNRYTLTAIIFLFIVISYGFFEFAKAFDKLKLYKMSIVLLILIVILYIPFFYNANNYFILSKEKLLEAPKTAEFIKQLPKDGIMTQIGYGQELLYSTNKRIMALPITPEYMSLIERYNISYLLYGEFYSEPFEEYSGHMYNYDTIKYIRELPEKFKLLAVIEETYLGKDRKDHIYIYEVMPN